MSITAAIILFLCFASILLLLVFVSNHGFLSTDATPKGVLLGDKEQR
jgi:hypothetical protein